MFQREIDKVCNDNNYCDVYYCVMLTIYITTYQYYMTVHCTVLYIYTFYTCCTRENRHGKPFYTVYNCITVCQFTMVFVHNNRTYYQLKNFDFRVNIRSLLTYRKTGFPLLFFFATERFYPFRATINSIENEKKASLEIKLHKGIIYKIQKGKKRI